MTEYWVSNARKYCDFCKCTIADNKPSVQFHENGKKHKENVRLRLAEMTKKATKEAKSAATVEKQIQQMEQAAMKAYMKDIEVNPDFTSQVIKEKLNSITAPTEPTVSHSPSKVVPPDKSAKNEEAKPVKKWYEAKSDEGYTYYWHIETEESVWEAPKDGFMSIAEQEKSSAKEGNTVKDEPKHPEVVVQDSNGGLKKKKEPKKLSLQEVNQKIYGTGTSSSHTIKTEPNTTEPEPVIGPSPRANPYGTWTAVVKEEDSFTDLELPEVKMPVFQVPDLPPEERQKTFKERKAPVPSGVSDGEVAFKKRKFGGARNVRQRAADD